MTETVFREWEPSDAQRSDRSAGDRSRHRQKIREAIRENIADIVAEEAIIGRSRDRIVKVPIRGIREYRFTFGRNQPGVAQGGGGTEEGQVIGEESGEQGEGRAGDTEGTDYYETEISLEELVDIMFEDLELPDHERKKLREIEVSHRRRRLGYRRKGIRSQLALKRSARQRVRRLQKTKRGLHVLEGELDRLRREADRCRRAGAGEEADRLLAEIRSKERRLDRSHDVLTRVRGRKAGPAGPAPRDSRLPFREEDLRYFRPRENPQKESNAVVLCIMDTSGSMHRLKKYLARSFFFLLHRFVSTRYRNVEIVFIAHHVSAREVTEEEFFHKGESGGTYISSGYNKALEIIRERYHPSLWNIYAFHCSDGDNFDSDNENALSAAHELCRLCNLFGYGEIKPLEFSSYENSLLRYFSNRIDAENYQAILIERKEDIWPAFRKLLRHEEAHS